ncbi:YlcI/YnfO family protein [Ottowia testudinis]|uniref:Prevent-host-death protein n=1 Tax=Ottowia testudinis TaxID=2816950 RepID=A0A975H2V3_9BURK|nr:YlcI/YnfO family protein [Ottowia testudinis]QTD44595.1 hypothetical protein J1M35_16095 [Ottowia testudinis]
MRTATLPAVRVTPETRSLIESVLREGETLSTFIEQAAVGQAQWRQEDDAFHARGLAAAARLDAGGPSFTADQSLARLRALAQKAFETKSA